MCLLSIRILLSYLVFGDDLEDVGGVLSTMELPLSDLVSQSAANLLESAVDLLDYKLIIQIIIDNLLMLSIDCIHVDPVRLCLATELHLHCTYSISTKHSTHLLCSSRFSLLSEPPLKELCEESLVGASTRSSAFRSFVSSFILCEKG